MPGSFVFILGIVFLQYWICLYFRWFDIFWRAWTSIQILCTGERRVSNELLTWLLVSHIQLLILDSVFYGKSGDVVGLHVQLGGRSSSFCVFQRDGGKREKRDTHEMRNAKKKTHFVFALLISCISRLACSSSQLSNAKKFDACSVRYILIGSMVRVVVHDLQND